LAPTVGTLAIGVMDSMAFSLSSKSNSKIDGNQITFGTVDFQGSDQRGENFNHGLD
jgi:hypothetical protein